ncbi:hypothetical protein TIFTF001_000610 [Ficus carica]|uniref:Uncharacterized protein n=1 Tax=Ficus carica TaxID=3494 RepID=A0AA87ZH07_FICCA|nr:hypothetical protein TIFTF001_000610 [Ficus carica]
MSASGGDGLGRCCHGEGGEVGHIWEGDPSPVSAGKSSTLKKGLVLRPLLEISRSLPIAVASGPLRSRPAAGGRVVGSSQPWSVEESQSRRRTRSSYRETTPGKTERAGGDPSSNSRHDRDAGAVGGIAASLITPSRKLSGESKRRQHRQPPLRPQAPPRCLNLRLSPLRRRLEVQICLDLMLFLFFGSVGSQTSIFVK